MPADATPPREIARKPRRVFALGEVHSLLSSNVFRNRQEMSEFVGFGLDDVELLTAAQIRLTEQLFCEWHTPVENFVYRYLNQ